MMLTAALAAGPAERFYVPEKDVAKIAPRFSPESALLIARCIGAAMRPRCAPPSGWGATIRARARAGASTRSAAASPAERWRSSTACSRSSGWERGLRRGQDRCTRMHVAHDVLLCMRSQAIASLSDVNRRVGMGLRLRPRKKLPIMRLTASVAPGLLGDQSIPRA